VVQTSSASAFRTVLSTPGSYVALLTVTDNHDSSASTEKSLSVSESNDTKSGNANIVPDELQGTFCSQQKCSFTIAIDQPGFYVATGRLPQTNIEGFWGIEFNTSGGINNGGFNSGAILKENGDAPGFMAFYLSQPEKVRITPYEYTGKVKQMTLQLSHQNLLSCNRSVFFGPQNASSGQSSTTDILSPGFYVAEALSQSGAERGRFGFEISAQSMIGGVNIGGWIDSKTGGNGEGFGALAVGVPQEVRVNTFFGKTYGTQGSGYFQLDVYRQTENGRRVLFWSSTTP